MTALQAVDRPLCRCGHDKHDHDQAGFAPQCTAAHCTCLAYRPKLAAARPPAAIAATLAAHVSVLCLCGHTDSRHADGGCGAEGCDCPALEVLDEALVIEPAPPARVVVDKPGGLGALLDEGRFSPFKRTVVLAEKIGQLLGDLRGRLEEERPKVDAMRRIADLEAELKAARAQLHGTTPAAVTRTETLTGKGISDVCGRTGLKNVGVHQARAHGRKARTP